MTKRQAKLFAKLYRAEGTTDVVFYRSRNHSWLCCRRDYIPVLVNRVSRFYEISEVLEL
jgi:hypothetical protein